ncbi:MAG: hypothetical protein EHM14_04600 [Methanothrix sp.]|nr:MAG: hypothetical protein EHM14_04600 [Methanothrix sp.]
MKRKKILLVVLILGLSLIASASANVGGDKNKPTAKGTADAFADAGAVSLKNYDPYSIAWTSTWTWNDAKTDPVSMSGSTGQAYAVIDSFALADGYSNAFAYSQGPNMAQTETYTRDFAFVTDNSAYATAQSHAEGNAY